METENGKRVGAWCVAGVFIVSIAGWHVGASGAVVGIDSTATSLALTITSTPEAEIVGFTVASQTYNDLEFFTATAINNSVQTFTAVSSPKPVEDVPTALALISNQYITQGKANATGVNYEIGETVDAADGDLFFMYELVLDQTVADDVIVLPLSGTTPIAGWSLTINAGDYGAQTDKYRINLLPASDVGARGVTFTLADFTGGAGELTGVTGLRFNDPGTTWDPLSAGRIVTSIPEPGVLALVAALGVAGLRRRRGAIAVA
jgi:hypothetical protein